MKSFAVLGLGRFGRNVADELMSSGAQVLVADKSREMIEQYASRVTYAVCADLSDAEAIKTLGLENFDAVVVAMAENMEASIMSVMVAKEVGAQNVIAKSASSRMQDILLKVGADQVIYPERESAFRTARKLVSTGFIEFLDVSESLCLVEIIPKPTWYNMKLGQLHLNTKYGINVIAIEEGANISGIAGPDTIVKMGCTLLCIVHKDDIDKLS